MRREALTVFHHLLLKAAPGILLECLQLVCANLHDCSCTHMGFAAGKESGARFSGCRPADEIPEHNGHPSPWLLQCVVILKDVAPRHQLNLCRRAVASILCSPGRIRGAGAVLLTLSLSGGAAV